MAIEGPLRELGIHDVFQLLDLSRKTGVLRVTSERRDDAGTVVFENGRVVQASIRSNPAGVEDLMVKAGRLTEADLEAARDRLHGVPDGAAQLVDLLVDIGATTSKEVDRYLRQQIESAVFELMSWQEGYFSFEEQARDVLPAARRIAVSTESLLMEGARRIDEWSRIADTIPHAGMIADLASVREDRDDGGSQLDLLPHEWQVLTMIDGARDLRSIAAALSRDEFEIAKVAYGLVRTGVIEVRAPSRRSSLGTHRVTAGDAALHSARAHTRAGRHAAALDELRRASQRDPESHGILRALGYAAARTGDLSLARTSWARYLEMMNGEPEAQPVRDALAALTLLTSTLDADVDR
jgi:hypothetical protein